MVVERAEVGDVSVCSKRVCVVFGDGEGSFRDGGPAWQGVAEVCVEQEVHLMVEGAVGGGSSVPEAVTGVVVAHRVQQLDVCCVLCGLEDGGGDAGVFQEGVVEGIVDEEAVDGWDAVFGDEVVGDPDLVRVDGGESGAARAEVLSELVDMGGLDDRVVVCHGRETLVDLADVVAAALKEGERGARYEADGDKHERVLYLLDGVCAGQVQHVGEEALAGLPGPAGGVCGRAGRAGSAEHRQRGCCQQQGQQGVERCAQEPFVESHGGRQTGLWVAAAAEVLLPFALLPAAADLHCLCLQDRQPRAAVRSAKRARAAVSLLRACVHDEPSR